MALRLWFKSQSIGAKIFGAFVVMSLMTGGLGLYSIYVLNEAGRIVVETYDKPLMATNFARSASLTFSLMDKDVLRRTLAEPDDAKQIDEDIDALYESFLSDLVVAEERALSADEGRVIEEIKAAARDWNALRKIHDPAHADQLTDLSKHVVERFDVLIELIADHSFIARRKAVWSISAFNRTSIAATGLALLLAVGITVLLTRRIIRPLADAAAVADRIAHGEFEAPIPAASGDETGALLRSMKVMQISIREMVAREHAQAVSARGRLADAIQSSHEGMALIDAGGRVVIANRQIADFFPTLAPVFVGGADFATLFATILAQLVDRSEAHATLDAAPAAQAAGLRYDGEYRLFDGRWVRISSSNTQDGGFFLFLSDFTEVKQREENLREAKQMAEAASKAKTSFLATMSHELRTPLNAIIGFAEVMQTQLFGALGHVKYGEYAGNILDSGQHLLDVINTVLEFAKNERVETPLHIEAVSLGPILADCIRMIRPQCEKAGLALYDAPSAIDFSVAGEPAKLRQVFINLLSNAVKFTETGGSITVVMRGAGPRVEIQIIDTGIGIAPADIPTALAPFGQIDNRVARRYEGTGLGLPLAKSLTEQHGGTLEIASESGHGTTITISLPILVSEPVALQTAASATADVA